MPKKSNAKWHAAHKMPNKPSFEQRVEWHVAHAKACACRAMPVSVKSALQQGGVHVRKPRSGG